MCQCLDELQDFDGGVSENPLVVKLESFIECLCRQSTQEQLLSCIKHRADWVLALLWLGSTTQYGADLMIDAFDLAPQDVKNVQVKLDAADDNTPWQLLCPHRL